jgi:hypothetical protein
MAYRDLVRDEAIAAAKAYAHPEVEPRHLLWGLVEVLDSSTPETVPRAAARALLLPRGRATHAPPVPAAIESQLVGVTSRETAIGLCASLGRQLLAESGGPATPSGTPAAAPRRQPRPGHPPPMRCPPSWPSSTG